MGNMVEVVLVVWENAKREASRRDGLESGCVVTDAGCWFEVVRAYGPRKWGHPVRCDKALSTQDLWYI